jgi:alkanesulfonate monooxygenase
MPVEFISAINVRDSDELHPKPGRGIEPEYLARYARNLEDAGFDYTLVPYGSAGFDAFTVAATVAAHTERIKPIVALRPNIVFPTVAAQQLATLDQLSKGRAVVHIISGGSDAEQRRQGDYLDKDARYDRSAEYIDILRRSFTETQPFSHEGTYYRFEDFGPGFPTYSGGSIPISLGGSSDAAYRVGGEQADIFGLWGEPLADTQEQIDKIYAAGDAIGRTDRPRIWVTFRPIVAATDEQAWEKAYATLEILKQHNSPDVSANLLGPVRREAGGPANVGSQRLLDIAKRKDVHDRALWTPTATVTGAAGASTALVGSYETVAAAILDYVDLGADLISIRGYDNLNDAIDYGRYVLPLVRAELAHRASSRQPVGASA